MTDTENVRTLRDALIHEIGPSRGIWTPPAKSAIAAADARLSTISSPEIPDDSFDAAPVAWRTFDGEGGYDYRDYEMNEQYADEWAKRNPKHKGGVDALYTRK